ncbi:MAG: ATP-grasp domain-containing protein [Burkholderiales bacterium]|nr:ATP-grasp domain-containing protein [Burkholderiales bacterium]
MKSILLLLPVTSYRNDDFLAAADKLGVQVIPVADYCPQLAPGWGMDALSAVHFDQPLQAAQTILAHLPTAPDAVLAVDDHGLEVAALLREQLGLPGNSVGAVGLTRDKLAFRHLLEAHGFYCPDFRHLPHDTDPAALAPSLRFPVVVKARRLSASRGVVRANNAHEFISAVHRVREIQGRVDRESHELGLVVEAFIPGQEYALEGMLTQGELKVLALFDKPDPLDGPYFEETIYVTPSRLPEALQTQIVEQVARACHLAGLTTGPVHAEMRINAQGVWLLEVAARSIGGLCGRMLRHALGMSLEEVLLRHALNQTLPEVTARGTAGVMMIPIPKRGLYQSVQNLDAARALPHITEIQITVEAGALLLPAPEGASYLGFIFSQADTPQAAEQALRAAHRLLAFEIQTEVPVAAV